MNQSRTLIAALLACVAPMAHADDFDGTKQLLCAITQARSCVPASDCEITPPEAVDVPTFIELEFSKKQISDLLDREGERKTPIERQRVTDDELVLQGFQYYSWTIAIDRGNGRMTMSAVRGGEAIVLFGACTVP